MVQESLSIIEERLSQIDHEIEEYRKCIEALEEEKKNILNNENAEIKSIKATEKHKVENISINRTNSAKDNVESINLTYLNPSNSTLPNPANLTYARTSCPV